MKLRVNKLPVGGANASSMTTNGSSAATATKTDDDGGLGDMTNVNEYGEAKEPLAQWLQKTEVIQYIQKAFANFLRSFSDGGVHTYETRITDMCDQNKQSFEVKFTDLASK